MSALTFSPGDPAHKVNPWPFYQRLLDEAPVLFGHGAVETSEDFYVVSRYEDVAMLLRDKQRVSSHVANRLMRGELFIDLPAMVNRDAPDHTRLRRVTNRCFGPRTLGPLTPAIQQTIDELIAELLSQPEVEYVEQFTTELPLRVVGRMLGIPLDRKSDIQRWAEAFLEMTTIIAGGDPALVPGSTEDFLALVNFIDEQATGRVGCPHRGDILSDLVTREASGELSHDEVVSLGWSYIAAGQDTTMNLLGGGLQILLSDPALAQRLAADPDRTEDFIEEYLRLYSPTQFVLRRLTVDVELQGVLMPAGSLLHLLIGAANRDPRVFTDPDTFDLDRPNAADHLAFGAGAHFCPGTVLARLLGGMSFRSLYPHLGRLSLDPARPPRMRTKPGAYGIEHMPVLVSQDAPAMAN